jgi:hypothetical protein
MTRYDSLVGSLAMTLIGFGADKLATQTSYSKIPFRISSLIFGQFFGIIGWPMADVGWRCVCCVKHFELPSWY